MKSPLRYQITDFDCGSVSLINCLTYLFEREEVPAELVRIITTFSLECYNEKGMLENNAYTKQLNYVVSKWVSEFARQKMIPLKSLYLTGEKIGLSMIVGCLKREGCVNVKTYRDGYEHYVMLTDIDDDYVYMFDPYYCYASEYRNNPNVDVIVDMPFNYNRKVKLEHFLSEKKQDYMFGPVRDREIIWFERNDAVLEREFE